MSKKKPHFLGGPGPILDIEKLEDLVDKALEAAVLLKDTNKDTDSLDEQLIEKIINKIEEQDQRIKELEKQLGCKDTGPNLDELRWWE